MLTRKSEVNTGEAVVDRVRSILSNSKVSAIRKLGVAEGGIGVVLSGQVSLYYYKQLAQELVRSELEDLAIFNRIEVVDPN
jgi:hypothetical protein